MSISLKKVKETIRLHENVYFEELPPFTVGESTDYILEAFRNREGVSQPQIEEIVGILGDKNGVIPFNLNKVVSYISESNQPIGELLANIKQRPVPEEWLQTDFYDGFMEDAIVARILKYIPYFDPDSIDLSLLVNMTDQKRNNDLDKALNRLVKNFLIKINKKSYDLSVHRLLQKELTLYFKVKLTVDNEIDRIQTRFIEIIDLVFKYSDLISYSNLKNMPFTHAERIIQTEWFEKLPDNEIKARLFEKMGIFYFQGQTGISLRVLHNSLEIKKGLIPGKINFDKPLEYLKKALETLKRHWREKNFTGDRQLHSTEEHQQLAKICNTIGFVYIKKRDLDKALFYMNKALSFLKQELEINEILHFGDNETLDETLADTHNKIGLVFFNKGDWDKAYENYNTALNIQKKLYINGHRYLAYTYIGIGIVCKNKNDLDKALEHLNEALKIFKRLFDGKDHAELVTTYINIGMVYFEKGQLDKALQELNEAFKMCKRHFTDQDHELLATTYNSIGVVYRDKRQLEKAIEYLNKALEMFEKLFSGQDHEELASTYNNIGMVYVEKGQLDEAQNFLNKALEMCKKLFADQDHQLLARTYKSIGVLHREKGEYETALLELNNALVMFEKLFSGQDHKLLVSTYNDIGSVFRRIENFDEALKNHRIALEMCKKLVADQDHQLLATTYKSIGLVYQGKGQLEKAIENLNKALKMFQKLFSGQDHEELVCTYNNIGMVYLEKGQSDEAHNSLNKALELCKKLFADQDHQLLVAT